MPNYHLCRYHGEKETRNDPTYLVEDEPISIDANVEESSLENRMTKMVHDATGPGLCSDELPNLEKEPNLDARIVFDLLEASKRPLYKGYKMTHLSATSRLIAIKPEYVSKYLMNAILSLCKEVLPSSNVLAEN